VNQHIFTVFGSPVAQGRPRFARMGNFVRTYDPAKSVDWKRTIMAQVLDQLGGKPDIHDGPLTIQMHFHLPRPKSLPKKVQHHVKKPDCDNLMKAADALKGILFRDDSQIVRIEATKQYGNPPRVVIGLREAENG